MEATLIIRCHCGDNYAVVCPSCKESPKAEVCPKGTLDALRRTFRALGAYLDGPPCAGNYDPKGALEAARAILDAAGEGKPDATT